MSKKAELVFRKYAGVGTYLKSLVDATKELPFNVEAFKIYSGEASKNAKEIARIKVEKFLGRIKPQEYEDEIEKLIKETQDTNVEKRLQTLASNIKRFKSLRKPYVKKIKKGLVIPGVAAGGTVAGANYIRTKIREDEIK